MLKLFEVKGFKNFKDKISLDFTDIRDYKFNTKCITNKLLSKIIIYGKNSIGKTNLGLAIFDIISHLTGKNSSPQLYDYYLNVNNSEYAEFHYIFQFDNDTIDYIYKKDATQKLIYEKITLNNDAYIISERNHLKVRYAHSFSKNITDEDFKKFFRFKDIDSILRYFVNNIILDAENPLRKMMTFVSNMLWFRSLEESKYIGYTDNIKDFYNFINDNEILDEFQEFLHTTGIEENLVLKTDIDGKKRLYWDTPTPLPFMQTSSSGTKALYTFFYWYKTAKDVSLMFIDEFDAYYHYELAESIVSILEKMSNTQVILTSHNTNLLSNRIMRPDCYFILTKNGLTSLINSTDRELREGHNLEKLYMSGEFNG